MTLKPPHEGVKSSLRALMTANEQPLMALEFGFELIISTDDPDFPAPQDIVYRSFQVVATTMMSEFTVFPRNYQDFLQIAKDMPALKARVLANLNEVFEALLDFKTCDFLPPDAYEESELQGIGTAKPTYH